MNENLGKGRKVVKECYLFGSLASIFSRLFRVTGLSSILLYGGGCGEHFIFFLPELSSRESFIFYFLLMFSSLTSA